MSLNGKKVCDFSVKAYQNGEFIDVTQENLKGQWSVLFFYPADFTFVCPTELADLQDKYAEFRRSAARSTPYPATPISYTKHGMNRPTASARSNIR